MSPIDQKKDASPEKEQEANPLAADGGDDKSSKAHADQPRKTEARSAPKSGTASGNKTRQQQDKTRAVNTKSNQSSGAPVNNSHNKEAGTAPKNGTDAGNKTRQQQNKPRPDNGGNKKASETPVNKTQNTEIKSTSKSGTDAGNKTRQQQNKSRPDNGGNKKASEAPVNKAQDTEAGSISTNGADADKTTRQQQNRTRAANSGNDKLSKPPVDQPRNADARSASKSGIEAGHKASSPKDDPVQDKTFSFDFLDEKFAEDKQTPTADSGKNDAPAADFGKDTPQIDAGDKEHTASDEEKTPRSKKRSEKKENRERTVFGVSLLFSFLLSLLLVLTSILVIVRIAVSESVITRLVLNEEYYGILLENIETQAQDYTIPTGIDTSVPTGLLDTKEIAYDLMNYVHYTFNSTPYEPNKAPLQKRVNARATEYYEKLGEIDEETAAVIDAYAEDIADIYANSITIAGFSYICEIESFLTRLFPVFLFFAAAGIFLLVRLFIRLQYYPHKGLRFAAYASGGAALILLAGPLAFYLSKVYTKINLASYPLYYLATSLIENTVILFFIAAGILAVVTVALIVVVVRLKKLLSKSE